MPAFNNNGINFYNLRSRTTPQLFLPLTFYRPRTTFEFWPARIYTPSGTLAFPPLRGSLAVVENAVTSVHLWNPWTQRLGHVCWLRPTSESSSMAVVSWFHSLFLGFRFGLEKLSHKSHSLICFNPSAIVSTLIQRVESCIRLIE